MPYSHNRERGITGVVLTKIDIVIMVIGDIAASLTTMNNYQDSFEII